MTSKSELKVLLSLRIKLMIQIASVPFLVFKEHDENTEENVFLFFLPGTNIKLCQVL